MIEYDAENPVCQQCEYGEVCSLENHENADYCPRRDATQ